MLCTSQRGEAFDSSIYPPLTQYSPPLRAMKLYLISKGLQNLRMTSPKGNRYPTKWNQNKYFVVKSEKSKKCTANGFYIRSHC